MKKIIFFLIICLCPSLLYGVEFKGKFEQGSFIIGVTTPGAEVTIDKKTVRVTDDGYFAFGIGRDRKNNVLIKVKQQGKTETIEKQVFKREYRIQRIDGLPQKQVTPPPEVYDRIKSDNVKIGKARQIDSDLVFFKNKFEVPIKNSIITGVYGSQRILNGKPRNPHYGLDFAGDEGTPIKAMLDGVVTLAEKDMYYTGGTLIFDHGHGISTLYMHLKDVDVKLGDKVKQGQVIGTVGKTGRATGAHLDIRLNWFEVKLDPASVLDLN